MFLSVSNTHPTIREALTNVQLVKGMGFGTDAEAIRVVTAMPRREPGQQSGKAVRVWQELPIRFELD